MRDSPRRTWEADLIAIVGLALVVVYLFRAHLLGRVLFIGDSDRLNSFLNILKHDVEAIRRGSLQAWTAGMFMGLNTQGLPYTFPNPLTYLESIAPPERLYWTAGLVSATLLIFAGWAAYLFIRDVVPDCFPAYALYRTVRARKWSTLWMSLLLVLSLEYVALGPYSWVHGYGAGPESIKYISVLPRRAAPWASWAPIVARGVDRLSFWGSADALDVEPLLSTTSPGWLADRYLVVLASFVAMFFTSRVCAERLLSGR